MSVIADPKAPRASRPGPSRRTTRGNFELYGWVFMRASGVVLVVLVFGHLFVNLMVGGPEGLAPEVQARSEQRWSLSPLTLPHPLVRILVGEQLYRAWTVLAGHPYHK